MYVTCYFRSKYGQKIFYTNMLMYAGYVVMLTIYAYVRMDLEGFWPMNNSMCGSLNKTYTNSYKVSQHQVYKQDKNYQKSGQNKR